LSGQQRGDGRGRKRKRGEGMSVSDKGGLQVVANITPTCHVQTVDGRVSLSQRPQPPRHCFCETIKIVRGLVKKFQGVMV